MRQQLAELVSTGMYLGAWRVVWFTPEPFIYRAFDVLASLLVRRGGRGVDQLRANMAVVRPALTPDELNALTLEAMQSYLRYWCDAFRLPDWTTARITSTCRDEPAGAIVDAVAQGRGVVLALGHLGNWDHAGAWVTVSDLPPVTTVAERLKPDAVRVAFLEFRRALGMQIHTLGDDGVLEALEAAVRSGGLVPLLADRDLTDSGLAVTLCGQTASVAAGPALLAERTGAVFLVAAIAYERCAASPSGWGIVINVDEVPASTAATQAERVTERTQAWANILTRRLQENPQDWHMLQRVFR